MFRLSITWDLSSSLLPILKRAEMEVGLDSRCYSHFRRINENYTLSINFEYRGIWVVKFGDHLRPVKRSDMHSDGQTRR
jgi:hypothetical protein